MKYKQLFCSIFALVLIGSSMASPAAVFADELNEDTTTSEALDDEFLETTGEGEDTSEISKTVEELDDEDTKTAEENVVAPTRGNVSLMAAPSNNGGEVLRAGEGSDVQEEGEEEEEEIVYDYAMEVGDSKELEIRGVNDSNDWRCNVEPADGLKCGKEGVWTGRPVFDFVGGNIEATKPGAYTVVYEHRERIPFSFDYKWVNRATISVAVYNLDTSAQEEVVLGVNDDFEYEINTENTFGKIHTEVTRNGEVIAEADGTDAIDIDTSEAGEYTVKIVNTSAANAGFTEEATYSFVVYAVVADENDDMYNDEAREGARAFLEEQIKDMLAGGSDYMDYIFIDMDAEGLRNELLENGQQIESSLIVYILDEEEWEDAEAYEAVMAEIKDTETLIAFYQAYLRAFVNNRRFGTFYSLDKPIQMSLEIPEEYREVPDGYTRVFYVIRGHLAMDDTTSGTRITVIRDGNYLLFDNDLFSSFAIVYEDILNPAYGNVGAPNTGANIEATEGGASANLSTAVVTAIAAVTMAGAAVFAKRR